MTHAGQLFPKGIFDNSEIYYYYFFYLYVIFVRDPFCIYFVFLYALDTTEINLIQFIIIFWRLLKRFATGYIPISWIGCVKMCGRRKRKVNKIYNVYMKTAYEDGKTCTSCLKARQRCSWMQSKRRRALDKNQKTVTYDGPKTFHAHMRTYTWYPFLRFYVFNEVLKCYTYTLNWKRFVLFVYHSIIFFGTYLPTRAICRFRVSQSSN